MTCIPVSLRITTRRACASKRPNQLTTSIQWSFALLSVLLKQWHSDLAMPLSQLDDAPSLGISNLLQLESFGRGGSYAEVRAI